MVLGAVYTPPEVIVPPEDSVTVQVTGDRLPEPNETFFVNLSSPTNATITTGQVVGTDVLFGLGLSLAGGGISFAAGNYQAALALKMSVGGILGAFVGANLLSILPARPLRVALSLWLVSLGGQLCWRAVAG